MKTKLQVIVGIVFLLCATAAKAADAPDKEKAETKIAALAEQWIAAYFKGDTATMKKLEAPELVVFNSGKNYTTDGRYDRIDQQVKDGKWFPGGVTRSNESQTIRIIGDTAIAHGISSSKAADDLGRVVYTEVWMKRNGEWRVVHLQFEELK